MKLTEKQTKQAQDLIEKYGFCTLETQKELAKAGFFEKTEVQHLIVDVDFDKQIVVGLSEDIGFYSEKCMDYLPMPQMGEAWKALPKVLRIAEAGSVPQILEHNEQGLRYGRRDSMYCYFDTDSEGNETEAMCRLWLLLHKEGLL